MNKIEYKQLPKEILCYLLNKQIKNVEYETNVSEILVVTFTNDTKLEIIIIDYGFALRYYNNLNQLVEEVFV
jgi:hypothetical protein